jgi:glutathione-specific gamma-glutamylcyclotransferase
MWIFGYGSLMWRPGFSFLERQSALLRGWRRSLCVYSHVHRGTPERPGLVVGLDRSGSCRGVAFRVDDAAATATTTYLRERELVTQVYVERLLPVLLADGRRVDALAYVVDVKHSQYAGRLTPAEQLVFVRQGVGASGDNPSYVTSTHLHIRALGFVDPVLEWISEQLEGC